MRTSLKIVSLLVMLCASCQPKSSENKNSIDTTVEQEVNVYTHRHYDTDKKLFAQFTEETGINVNVVNASADELINKLELEGENSPADVLITVDAGRLHSAKQKNLLQSVSSEKLETQVPELFRDPEGHWFGLTYRARVIAYSKESVNPEDLSTYEDLVSHKWVSKILVRSSDNIYNQSLMASIIAYNGNEKAKKWAEGIVKNMARSPKGNDRDQVKAIKAGVGDLALVNTYYIGILLNSEIPEEVEAGESVGIYFPNQKNRGTHINLSGIGVTAHSPNKENAIRFIEFLSGPSAQKEFAEANFEYPVNPQVEASALLQSWGTFKADTLSFSTIGELNKQAVVLFDEAKWQ